jgi:hypothetical chaperone protein
MQQHLYGIDFGTTNSVLSIFDRKNKEIIDTISIPSILYFPIEQHPDKMIHYLTGNEAINCYLNEGMKGRFMKSIKQVLPISNFLNTRIGNQIFTASDLVSFILIDLKMKADQIVGYECDTVILGRPVFFDDSNKQKDDLAQTRLNEAAEKAGFSAIKFQFEPISAAFSYEKSILKKEKVLVADLGGGTTDFTYIELDPLKSGKIDRREDIKATGGIYIGGDNFDSAFMWEKGTPNFGRGLKYESMPGKMVDLPTSFFQNICSWKEMNFFNGQKVKNSLNQYYIYSKRNPLLKNLITLIDLNLGFSIFQNIEKVKIKLTHESSADFNFDQSEILINENITIEEYNSIIRDEVTSIEKYLNKFIETNTIQISEIDTIFLTGGTSLVGEIQKLFKEKFPKTTINSGDNFMSVAQGLALSEYLFNE